jgi:hypothetical protein
LQRISDVVQDVLEQVAQFFLLVQLRPDTHLRGRRKEEEGGERRRKEEEEGGGRRRKEEEEEGRR